MLIKLITIAVATIIILISATIASIHQKEFAKQPNSPTKIERQAQIQYNLSNM